MLTNHTIYHQSNESKPKKNKAENLLLAFIERYSIIGIVYSD